MKTGTPGAGRLVAAHLLAYLAVALVAAAVSIALWIWREQQPLLNRIERLTLDAQMLWRGRLVPAAEHGVLLVAIDDRTLQRLGNFVPDRRQLAQAVDRLAAAEARVIALDLLLLDPARPDPSADEDLARAMRAAGKVLIPFALPIDGAPDVAAPGASVTASAFLRYAGEAAQQALPLRPARLAAPPEPLAEAATALGHVTVQRGVDGGVRFDLPGLPFGGEVYPSMALRIAGLASAADWRAAQLRFGEAVELGARRVPLDARSRQWVNYYGPAGSFETVSFIDLIEGKVDAARLKGRIALIGVAALGTGDNFPTPFDGGLPGVERLATVVDNILSERSLQRPAWASNAELAAMLLLPLLAVGLIAVWRPRWALLTVALLAVLLVAGLQQLFVQQHGFLSLAFPALALALSVIAATALRSGVEQGRKKAAVLALRASEERYALAQQGANDGLWDWDIAADQVYFSPRWLALMSVQAAEAGRMAAWTAQLDAAARSAFDTALAEHLAGRSAQFNHVLNFRQGGAERWLLARGVATRGAAGQALRMAGSLTDITEQQQLQRQITFDALHDRLTGLPNRALFLERLGQMFEGTAQSAQVQAGVVLVDIDGFRALNEQEGTQAADAVLIELARRLGSRDGQPQSLARLGADRFGLLFNAPLVAGGVDEARRAAWALSQMQALFQIGAQAGPLSASVGWAHASQGPANADELLNAAEMALAHAKAKARGQVHGYDPAEQLVENSRRWLRENIDLALQRGEFRLFYQPLVRLGDRQLLGFEALIRWPHPSKGMVMPGDFIPFAEESGQIVAMGRWILLEAARQLVAWDALGFTGEIAVNLSSAQFSQGDLAADAQAVLAILGTVSPRRIKLEVTESMAMANPQVTTLALQSLVALGFKISIDDFGTGYSSLAYLHRFPFDTLKIDRSFVIRLAAGREAVEIVRTIVGLALALDKQVLAEGIEEESQAQVLQELGVQVGQGWLFSKALPADAAQALVIAAKLTPL